MLRKTIHATLIVILMMGAASAQIKDNPGFYNGGGETSDEAVKARERKKSDSAIDRSYHSKQVDDDYKAATSKIPDQKPNDPWGAIRPAPSTLNPKTPTVAGAKKKQQ